MGAQYDGLVKELILRLKFHRLRSAAEVAAELVLGGLPADMAPDVVTWVPVSASRRRERGYNQSELVGRLVARRLGAPAAPLLARATSSHQLGTNRRTRLQQVRGAFYALRRLDGERVLLVDDVMTTGATMAECAAVLRKAGAGPVWGGAAAGH